MDAWLSQSIEGQLIATGGMLWFHQGYSLAESGTLFCCSVGPLSYLIGLRPLTVFGEYLLMLPG